VTAESAIEIRSATESDLPGLLRLYCQLAEDSARVSARSGLHAEALPASPEDAVAIFHEAQADPRRELLVAVLNGHLLGTADLVIVPNLTHGGKPWAIVENVAVDASTRRTGIGTRLMLEVERRIKLAGCYKVQLLTRKQRHVAHAFYEALGFEASAEGFRRYFDTPPA